MGLAKELRSRRTLERREVTVEAWGDESGPYKLFCRSITCYDLDVLQKKHPTFLQNTTIGAMIDLVVMKAEDESGDKLFTKADRADLMGEETNVISEIANQMFAEIIPVQDAEGN